MNYKKKIVVALLALGTIGGYAAGFASLRCRGQHRRAAFERHVAQLCVDAARASAREQSVKPGQP
jgi:hypothetical protein